MPKDLFGRQTNVNKAHKAALKMDKKIDKGTVKGQKAGVLVSARDYGYKKGIDAGRSKMVQKGSFLGLAGTKPSKTDSKKETAQLATQKLTRSSRVVGRKQEGKAYIDAGTQIFGMKPGKVTKQIKKGEKAGLKSANKVYKAAKKINKIKSSLG